MAIYSNRIVISISKTGVGPWLNIANSQSIPSQAGLQVMWQVPVSTLQSRFAQFNVNLNSNLSNLRFVYNGQFVPAWLESINNGTATIWIKMPVSIPANSSITLNLYSNSGLNFDGVYWGEAPQLSPTYGQYDNGASVFNNYWNFAGTSLPSGWSAFGGFADYSVNNGLIITGATGGAAGLKSNVQLSPPYILETYANYPPESLPAWFNIFGVGTSGNQQLISIVSNNYIIASYNRGSISSIIASSGTGIWSVIGLNSSVALGSLNYSSPVSSTASNPVSFPANIYSPSSAGGTFSLTNPITEYYIRTRAYPPNGVMPTVRLM